MFGDILYETENIAYNTDTKDFFNPKDNSIYGKTAPTGGWPITWYMGSNNTPVVVSGNQTAAQISAQLAAQKVTTVNDSAVSATNFLSGKTFGVDNILLIGGIVVIGGFMLFSGRRGR